jgi:hypothetical protein
MPNSKNLQIAREILLPNLLQMHPEIIGVLFCGSRVTEQDFYPESDFDFRCILPDDQKRYRVTRKFDQYLLEYFCNDKAQELKYLNETQSSIDQNMYRQGIILYDPQGILLEIKSQVLAGNFQQSFVLSPEKKAFAIYSLAIHKLKLLNPNLDGNFLLLENIFGVVLDFYFALLNQEKPKPLLSDQFLESQNPQIYMLAKKFCVASNFLAKKELLIELIKQLQIQFNLPDSVEIDTRQFKEK